MGLPNSRSSARKPAAPPVRIAISTFSTHSFLGAGWAGRSSNSLTSSANCSATGSTWCRCAPYTRCCGRQSWPKPGPSMQRDILLLTEMVDAAEQLSAELKDRFPDITWQQPMRLRNRIVHGYWSIDLEVLHTTATEQLPAFAASLRSVLSTLTDSA